MSAPALPPAGRPRKHRSKSVELNACLHLLGIDPSLPFQWQHEPPLGTRPFIPELDDYEPRENDYRHLRPMQTPAHAKVTKEVDRPAIDKTRRVAKSQLAHQRRLLVKDDGGVDEALAAMKRKRAWGKGRKLQSRGFARRK